MEIGAQSVALLLADARLPTGGHAHSGGMEPAVTGGLPPDQVRDFLIGRARTTSIVEAGTAVAACVAAHEEQAAFGLNDVTAAWAARTPSPAQREAARALGRGYLRLARRLWPERVADLTGDHPRSVLLGVIAAAAGVRAAELARLSVYDDAQTAASALLKLRPQDPLVGVQWVLEACAAAEDLIPLATAAIRPEAIPAFGAPQAEGWAEAHALETMRLFRA